MNEWSAPPQVKSGHHPSLLALQFSFIAFHIEQLCPLITCRVLPLKRVIQCPWTCTTSVTSKSIWATWTVVHSVMNPEKTYRAFFSHARLTGHLLLPVRTMILFNSTSNCPTSKPLPFKFHSHLNDEDMSAIGGEAVIWAATLICSWCVPLIGSEEADPWSAQTAIFDCDTKYSGPSQYIGVFLRCMRHTLCHYPPKQYSLSIKALSKSDNTQFAAVINWLFGDLWPSWREIK